MEENPLQIALRNSPGNILFLDGGFATHLETLGQNITDSLWSAKLLITNPSIITKAHYDYLKNGSNIIITSSYQANIKGFTSNPYNLTYQQAVNKMSESVTLAANAIDKYRNENINHTNKNLIVAGSIGCYGAGLADGSEYTGYYGDNINEFDLREYHSVKMHAIMKMKMNINYDIILACETIPNIMEIKVLTQLLNEYEYYGWITMACCNEYQLNSKEFVSDAIDTIIKYNTKNYVVGIGFNCTHPKYINDLLKLTNKCVKKYDKEFILIVYPNSGEEWDGKNKIWKANTTMSDVQFGKCALDWYVNGARIIGGCCRTTPNTINVMRKTILNYVNNKSLLQSKL
eukprot:156156_1